MSMDIYKKYELIRKRLELDYEEYTPDFETIVKNIDKYISDENVSELEKAFYLLLNQFPSDSKNYIVIPNEKILVENVYDISPPPYYEYELDFAIYGGVVDNPVKISIECDGIRSHRKKYNEKDRRKNINMQSAGWIVIRIGSHEIHEEINRFSEEDFYISELMQNIENVIKNHLNLIDYNKYSFNGVKTKLTGYKWCTVKCLSCSNTFDAIINHKKNVCPYCNKKFVRDRKNDPNAIGEFEGLIYYD